MLLVNYQKKYGQKLFTTTNQGLDGQKIIKTKKNEGIDNTDIKKLSGQFYLPPSISLHHSKNFCLQQFKK